MPPLLAAHAVQGPTIRVVSQLRHALSAMLEATAVMVRQPALSVMLEPITLRKEALRLHAFLVMLAAITLRKEPRPHLPALSVVLEATAVLDRQPAHCVMPVASIPPKEAQPALSVMLEAITLRKEARPHLPALRVVQDSYAAKKGFLNQRCAPQAIGVPAACN